MIMKMRIFLAVAVLLLVSASCSRGLITDPEVLKSVEEDFLSRTPVLESAGICLDSLQMTKAERQAMEFLYAYMPIGDVLNLPPEYHLDNCRLTFRALGEMPWGKAVPEREVRHFVLPVRVNNENLDTARAVFFRELAPRVKSLPMKDAILEVNHWCHEKAVYQPSDSRTSSPLATVMTATGRCGEESTFLVTALRSVGIPARQVYTPRWAHTDDNHAWVEAWADGEWHFLGACEPEPVLDLGWFNAPASRGMLMHTKVFGRYDGPEEVVDVTPGHTEINLISGYAPESARIDVTVKDTDGNPVPGAEVEYRLYNYAEFYPVAVKTADRHGHSHLTAGLGDMVVHATDGERFGFRKVSFGRDSEVDVVLSYDSEMLPEHVSLESVPPAENAALPEVTPEQRAENDRRMAVEDSLRNAYVSTFFNDATAAEYLSAKGFTKSGQWSAAQSDRLCRILTGSKGNREQMCRFLEYALGAGRLEDAVAILESVSEKDLRDTPARVFIDHLDNVPHGCSDRNVYCPRVSTELLTPFRSALRERVSAGFMSEIAADPSCLLGWCRDSLELMDSISMSYVQVAPARVWDSGIADRDSRDIFFVAMCRTAGVPAWKDPVTGTVRYTHGGRTFDVDFDGAGRTVPKTGVLKMRYRPIPLLKNPEYYIHFTLSRYENGCFELLNYPEASTFESLFARGARLPVGTYLLTSGTRMSSGNVLADMEFFKVTENETTVVDLIVRDDPSQYRIIGSFNSEALYDKIPAPGTGNVKTRKSVLSETGRGYFAVILTDCGTEPSDHVFRDIASASAELGSWGRPVLVVFASDNDVKKFDPAKYSLPSTVSFGVDTDGSMRRMIEEGMSLEGGGRLPLIVVADTFNRVVFFSQGYTIGLGGRLTRVAEVCR